LQNERNDSNLRANGPKRLQIWIRLLIIEADDAPKGLNEDIIRLFQRRKIEPVWMLEWRLKRFALENPGQ
jgi:hypothetical protein